MNSLYKVVPKSILPIEYGGDAGSIEDIKKYWEEKIFANRQFLIDDGNYGVDEKLRVGKAKNPENLFGMDGTFRKLQVD